MRAKHVRPTHQTATFLFGFLLFAGVATFANAGELPIAFEETILQRFPGAEINKTRQDTWEGQPVTEVEIETRDGDEYEVILSAGGEILNVEEEKGLPLIGGDLTIGLAATAERDIFKDIDSEIEPSYFLVYHNGPFHIVAYEDLNVKFDIYDNDVFAFGLNGSMPLDPGYHPDDSDYLKGMDELDTLYYAGAEASITLAGVETSLTFLQDVSGEHDGQQVDLEVGYEWTAAGFIFHPEVSLTWMSADMVDYLYGVGVHEARPDRPAYAPDASYEASAQLLIRRPIFGNFSIIGRLEATTYGSEITDSPIVEEDYSFEGALGVAYSF